MGITIKAQIFVHNRKNKEKSQIHSNNKIGELLELNPSIIKSQNQMAEIQEFMDKTKSTIQEGEAERAQWFGDDSINNITWLEEIKDQEEFEKQLENKRVEYSGMITAFDEQNKNKRNIRRNDEIMTYINSKLPNADLNNMYNEEILHMYAKLKITEVEESRENFFAEFFKEILIGDPVNITNQVQQSIEKLVELIKTKGKPNEIKQSIKDIRTNIANNRKDSETKNQGGRKSKKRKKRIKKNRKERKKKKKKKKKKK